MPLPLLPVLFYLNFYTKGIAKYTHTYVCKRMHYSVGNIIASV